LGALEGAFAAGHAGDALQELFHAVAGRCQ
jgi:hypothetical protein